MSANGAYYTTIFYFCKPLAKRSFELFVKGETNPAFIASLPPLKGEVSPGVPRKPGDGRVPPCALYHSPKNVIP